MLTTYLTSSRGLRGPFSALIATCLLILLIPALPARAQIVISGVADRQFYTNSVTFTIQTEAGYDYQAQLNSQPVPVGAPVRVDQPNYYELSVQRQPLPSGPLESTLVRFIIRASSRGSSESGLPVWTPYRQTPSAAGEFAGGVMEVIAPARYPAGLEIPIAIRILDGSGNRMGICGQVPAAGFEDYPITLLRGVGARLLPPAAQAEQLSYMPHISSLNGSKDITIEDNTTWHVISGDITTSTDLGDNARVRIQPASGDTLTISAGCTLSVGPASVIVLGPDVTVEVAGQIVVNGDKQHPAVFTAEDVNSPWGGFVFETSASAGRFNGAIFTASGADPAWFDNNPGHGKSHRKNQCLFYISNDATVDVNDCYMFDNKGQIAHGQTGHLTMTGSLADRCVTVGQFNGGTTTFTNCALVEFPSATAPFYDGDNDAMYLTTGEHRLTNCLVGWGLDDGVDAGDDTNGHVTIENCWFESCFHEGFALSGNDKIVDINSCVATNCGQGIECGYDGPLVTATNCISTANLVGARFGDNYTWTYSGFLTVTDSLLLFNMRDVWGRAWDNWSVHLDQMDIHGNYLTAPNANYPDNAVWDPENAPGAAALLQPFIPTAGHTVGVAFAVDDDSIDPSQLPSTVAVRLSRFTTAPVSVDYSMVTENGSYAGGTLQFRPGQTLQQLEIASPPEPEFRELTVVLSNPVNAELTGHRRLSYVKPRDSVRTLIAVGDDWWYFKGVEEPPADWAMRTFEPARNGWLSGPTGIGYEADSGYESCIATELSDMQGNYMSIYACRQFIIDDPSRVKALTLGIQWDDGYIAYLNGRWVDDRNAPNPPTYDQPASSHEADCGGPLVEIDLSQFLDELVPGVNVLAFQVHNSSRGSSDFLFLPELRATISPLPGDFEPDGDVDFNDFAAFAATCFPGGPASQSSLCDISNPADGVVDMRDLAVLIDNWLAGL